MKEVESTLEPYKEKEEIQTIFAVVAPGFLEPGAVNTAYLFATLTGGIKEDIRKT